MNIKLIIPDKEKTLFQHWGVIVSLNPTSAFSSRDKKVQSCKEIIKIIYWCWAFGTLWYFSRCWSNEKYVLLLLFITVLVVSIGIMAKFPPLLPVNANNYSFSFRIKRYQHQYHNNIPFSFLHVLPYLENYWIFYTERNGKWREKGPQPGCTFWADNSTDTITFFFLHWNKN